MPKTIIITGASDGVGAAAARRLHEDGHRVVVVGRTPEKTLAVADELSVDHYTADYSRLDDVRALAELLGSAYPRIDVLANNAGGVFGDPDKTEDGFEKTFQINHLAPFLLTTLLLDTLIASRATVIQTSSTGARLAGKVDIDDLNQDRGYSPIRAYGTAKLENILFTQELHRRYNDHGISAAAFHPGNVASSFGRQSESRVMRTITQNPGIRKLAFVTPEKGADQLAWLATAEPGTDWQSGVYYENRTPAKRVNAQARDPRLARQLWERSEQLLQI
ncbi:SDR family NAD(P)-dependent oxidoreductase [Aeromicrobium sp. CTD01-1L150]|uniref:SDR family NAD(P)-dependent oxidoreductase n=1 Tax=Aeromicrobium sp. CTD01-1L150 TaxID=3341830 RepID=UPI0035C1D6DD